MEPFKRILVCLEDFEQGSWMLRHTEVLSGIGTAEEIHMLHVRPAEPAGSPEMEQDSGVTEDSLRSLAERAFKGHGKERFCFAVITGAPLVEILRYAMDKNIDLILLGRRSPSAGEPPHEVTFARRITAKSTCSVLVIPQGAHHEAKRIMVPARNSECSVNALETACRMASRTGGTVCALNVFAVRSGYLKVGMTLEEHTALMHRWAKRECEDLLAAVDTFGVKVTAHCEPDLYMHPVPIILRQLEQSATDLIVIGARGRTGAAGVLLGMVTEQLMRQSPVPVLAVKKKGECLGVLRALLTLAS